MHPFVPVAGGYESLLDADERRVIADVVADVAALVSQGRPPKSAAAPHTDPYDALQGGDDTDGDEQAQQDQTQRDQDATLEALDFEPQEDPEPIFFADPALERLMPEASVTDLQLSQEFRRLTADDLREEKAQRLLHVWDELESPTGEYGAVRVAPQREAQWLAALTDVRLVLGVRLGLQTDADADRIEQVALGGPIPERDPQNLPPGVAPMDEGTERLMASLYCALTWWQESLLQSFGGATPSN